MGFLFNLTSFFVAKRVVPVACAVLLFSASLLEAGWISPTSNNNPSRWDNETLARDDDLTTYAECSPNTTGWGQALELYTTSAIKSRRLRVSSDYQDGVDAVRLEIRLSPSGTWSNVYEGAVSNQAWTIISFNPTNITGARFRFHFTATYTFWLYELQLFEEPEEITLPSCETLEGSSVEESTVILHGQILDDGGDLCQWRMQYGLTTTYSSNTAWTGSEVAGTHFSKILLGLETNTTYHYRAQVMNSAGIASGGDMDFTTGVPGTGWISPSGDSDPSNTWVNEECAYDDNTSSVARCRHEMGDPVWSPYLYLTHSTMDCDGIRFFARDSAETDQAEVGVYVNGAWSTVFTAAYTNQAWMYGMFTKGTVTQARIRFRLTSTSYGMDYEMYEFQFHRVVDLELRGHYDQATPVTLAINGVSNSTWTDFSTNVFTFSVTVGAGSQILLYYNDDNVSTNASALVTKATAQNMLDLDLMTNTLIVRSDNGSSFTHTDFETAFINDGDVPYRLSGSTLMVTNNITLRVPAGFTYAPGTNSVILRGGLDVDGTIDQTGGSITFAGYTPVSGAATTAFNNVTISGVLVGHTNTMQVGGSWMNNGTFSNAGGTVEFTGDTTMSGSSVTSFKNVLITGSLTVPGGTLNVAGNWINNGTFSNNNGTVNFNGTSAISGSSDSTFNHLSIAASSSLTAPTGTLYVAGDWNNGAGGTFNHNSNTVEFTGSGISTNYGSTEFYHFVCQTPGKQLRFVSGSAQTVRGTFNVIGDSTNQVLLRSTSTGSKWNIAFPTTPQSVLFVDVRDSNASNNTVTVSGGTDSGNNNTNWVFIQNRYWIGGSGSWTQTTHWAATSGGTGGVSLPATNQIVIFDSKSGSGTCTVSTAVDVRGFLIQGTNRMVIKQGTNSMACGSGGYKQQAQTFVGGSGLITLNGEFRLTGGTFIAPSDNLLSCGADFIHTGGAFTNNSGTVSFDGATFMTDTVTNPFNNITINGSLTAPAAIGLVSNFVNNGSFNANGGVVFFRSNTMVSGTSTTTFNGVDIGGTLRAHSDVMAVTGLWTNRGTFIHNNGTISFDGTTMIVGSRTSAFNHVVINGSLTSHGTLPVIVAGDWINNGSFDHNNSMIILTNSTTVGGASVTVFDDLTINGTLIGAADRMRVAGNWVNNGLFVHNGGTVVFNGNTTISGSKSNAFNHLTIWGLLAAPTSAIYVAGNWVNDGTFTHNNGTVVFNGASEVRGGYITTFYNVTVASGATLTGHSSTMSIERNWINDGVYNHNSGTVVFQGSSTSLVSGATTFNNFSCSTLGKPMTFTAGSSQTVLGSFDLNGSESSQIVLRSTSAGSVWNIVFPNGPQTVSSVNVRDSNASNNTVTVLGGTDSGNNNTNWLFVQTRYWVGGAGNWNQTTHWSASSGGSSGSSVPGTNHVVIFDSKSGSGTCRVTTTASVKGLFISGTNSMFVLQGTNTVTVGVSGYDQETHTYRGEGGVLTVNGNFDLDGGTFSAASNKVMYCRGNFTHTAGIFSNNSGTISFDGTTIMSDTVADPFNNITISGALTAPETLNLVSNFVNSGTFDANGGIVYFRSNTTVSGTSTTAFNHVSIGGTLTAPSTAMAVTGMWTNNGTFVHNGGRVQFNGATEISGARTTALNHVFINGSLTGPGTTPLIVAGGWTNNGAFDPNGGTVMFTNVTVMGGGSTSRFNHVVIGGTLTAPAGVLQVAGAWTNNGTFSHNNGTVVFNGDTTVSGTRTSSFNRVIISGALTGHASLPLIVAGAWTNNGNFDHNYGTVIFTNVTTMGGTEVSSFNNISIVGTLTAPSGVMQVAGAWTNNGTFSHNNGTVVFNGSTVISGTRSNAFRNLFISGSLTAPTSSLYVAGNWVNSGVFSNRNGTVVFNGTSAMSNSQDTVFNHLTIAAGSSLTAPTGTLYEAGNWNNSAGGTFQHNSNTVEFTGSGVSTGYGSTVFYHLACLTPGKQIYFATGTTQSVQGEFIVTGNFTNQVVLRSTAAGSKWNISFPNGAQNILCANVRDSSATNNTVTVVGGVDSGNNNTNWIFLQNRYWVGGSGNWSDTAHWSVTNGGPSGASPPGTNQFVFFESKSGSGTCTVDMVVDVKGLVLQGTNRMVIAQGTNPVTIGGGGYLQQAQTFRGQGGPVVVSGTYILSGGTFVAPSNNSVFYLTGFEHSGGSFTNNSGTVVFDGVTAMADTVADPFNNIVINGSLTAPATLRLVSNFVNNGTFDANAGTVYFQGNTTVSGAGTTTFNRVEINGALTAPTGALWVSGAWTNNGTFNHNNGIVEFNGATVIGGTQASAFNHVHILGTLTAPGSVPLRVGGDWVNDGTFNHNSGLVIFTNSTTVSGTSSNSFRNVTIGGTLTAPADTLRVAGAWTNTGIFNHHNGTVEFNGTTVMAGAGSNAFNHVIVSGSLTAPTSLVYVAGNWVDNGTFTHNNGALVFNGNSLVSGSSTPAFGNVMIADGAVLTGHAASMTVAGDWNNSNGTYDPNSGTVEYEGSSTSLISGATTFYNFFCDTPGKAFAFAAESSQTVLGSFSLTGEETNQIVLRSSVDGTPWNIVFPNDTQTVNYVDVRDSNASNNTVTVMGGTDSGNNNAYWIFTVLADRFWVGGAGSWNQTAHWSLTSGGAGGASVPGTSQVASFDNKSGSGTCSLNITITVKGLTMSGTNNIVIAQGIRSLTVGDSGISQHAHTFRGSRQVTVNGDFRLYGGTFSAPQSYALIFNGNFIHAGGTFSNNSGTVTFGGTTVMSDLVVDPFNNVTISGSVTAPDAIAMAGNWVNNGTFDAANSVVRFQNSTTVSGTSTTTFHGVDVEGTLTAHATAMGVSGNWTNNGTFNHNGGRIYFDGTTEISGTRTTVFNHVFINGSLSGHSARPVIISGGWTNNGVFYHNEGLILFTNATTIGGAATSCFKHVTLSGTLTAPAGLMQVAGNWTNNGTFNHNGGTVEFNGDTTINGTRTSVFNNVTISGTLGGHASRPVILSGDWVNDGNFNHNNGLVIFTNSTTIGGASVSGFKNVTISGTLTAPADAMQVAGNWTNNGTFNHNDGTVEFNGTTIIAGTRSNAFNNLAISGSLTAPTASIYVAGNWINDGVFTHNNGMVTFNGASAIGGVSNSTFYHLAIANGSSLTAPSGTLYVAGHWYNSVGGTFDHNSNTVEFTGSGVSTNYGSTTFYNLSCLTPGKQIVFPVTSNQNVLGAFTLQGESTNQIVLRSYTSGSKWNITFPNGPQEVLYVNVRDSNASNNTVTVSGGTDTGNNNTNWIFVQDRYWVGGAGIWTQTTHWSATAGGAGGASVPNTNQMAVFNFRSGSGTCRVTTAVSVRGILLQGTNRMVVVQEGTNSVTVGNSGYDQQAHTYRGQRGAFTAYGDFMLSGGVFSAPSNSVVSCMADFKHTGGIFSNNAGDISFDGTTILSDTVGNPFNDVLINGSLTAPATMYVASNFVNNGAFNANGGLVYFPGSTTVDGSSTTAFDNVSISGTFAASPNVMAVNGAWTNNGTFNHNGGTVVFNGETTISGTRTSAFNNVTINGTLTSHGSYPLLVAGGWTNNGTFNHNSGTVIFNNATVIGGSGSHNFNNVTIGGTLTAPGGTLQVAGNWANNGAFSPNNGTVVFNGNTIMSGAGSNAFHHLSIQGALTAPGAPIYVAGNWINDGTFNHNDGAVVFNGTSEVGGGNETSFNSVTIATNGVLTGYAGGMNVAKNWDGSAGIYYHNSGEVRFNGTDAQEVTTGGAYNGSGNNWKNNWNDITVLNASGPVTFTDGFSASRLTCTTPGASLYFSAMNGVTNVYEITEANGLTIEGVEGDLITLRRYGGSEIDQWELFANGWTISYVDVADALNTAEDAIYPEASTDSGNTANWFEPTVVKFGWLAAVGRDNSVTVRWKTESEANNAGFNVFRSPESNGTYECLNAAMIRGLGSSVRGREYRYVDDLVTNGTVYYYKVQTVEFDGATEMYGPAGARPGVDEDADGMADDWEAFYGVDDPDADPDGDGQTNLQEYYADTNPNIDEGAGGEGWGGGPPVTPSGNSGLYKLTVEEEGLYRLGYGDLSGTVTNLDGWIAANIRLYNQGREIPIRVHDEDDEYFGANDYFEFYGTGLDTRFTGRNIYWLYNATNAGRRIVETTGAGGGDTASNAVYMQHYELNQWYETELPDESPDDEHWFFADSLWVVGTNTSSIDLYPVLTDVSAAGTDCFVGIALRSKTRGTNTVRAEINGTFLGEAVWTGREAYVASGITAQTNLLDGVNTVTLTLYGSEETINREVYVDWIRITYLRDLQAVTNSLIFESRGEGARQFEIGGFDTNDVEVFKVASATNVTLIADAAVSGGGPYAVSFSDDAPSGTVYVASGNWKTPAGMIEDASSDLRNTTNQADYLIIAYDGFCEAMIPLLWHRETQGLRVRIVGLQDVYDDFNYGIESPYAIRDFLGYARDNWTKPSPLYVLLVGDATYDYRDYEGWGEINYLPTKMVHDSVGEVCGDNWYACLDGTNDYEADLFVGRFPARNTNDVAVMIGKTMDYEAASPEKLWARTAMFVADNDESRFEEICESTSGYMPEDYAGTNLFLKNYATAALCRNDVITNLNRGALIVNYAGHGTHDYWAGENIFGVSYVRYLTNNVALPFVVTPTCMNGLFDMPHSYGAGYWSLGEVLVRTNGRGAVAALCPSSMSEPPEQKRLVDGLFQAVFSEGRFEVGPAVARAKEILNATTGEASRVASRTFILFGDPALRLKQWSGYPADTGLPFVQETVPADGSMSVDPVDSVRITFSEPMENLSVRAGFSIAPSVEGELSWDGNTLVFDPAEDLDLFTAYTVTVRSVARDLAGHGLDGNGDGKWNGVPDDDFSFSFMPTWFTISGSITYTGLQTGVIRVLAFGAEDSWEDAIAFDTLSAPGAYSLSLPGSTSCWVRAYRDYDDDGRLDVSEARGDCLLNPILLTGSVVAADVELTDTDSDIDGDGLTDYEEMFIYQTNPRTWDTDRDGLLDLDELAAGTSPTQCDSDGDSINDYKELYLYFTDPTRADTDGDGMSDGNELIADTSALDSNDVFGVDSTEVGMDGNVVVYVMGHTNRIYTLQTGSTITDLSSWTTVDEKTGFGEIVAFTNAPDSELRFFLIGVRMEE